MSNSFAIMDTLTDLLSMNFKIASRSSEANARATLTIFSWSAVLSILNDRCFSLLTSAISPNPYTLFLYYTASRADFQVFKYNFQNLVTVSFLSSILSVSFP